MDPDNPDHARPEGLHGETSGSTGPDPEQLVSARQPSTDSAYNARIEAALERRLTNGRESQRRFRERQKVIASDLGRTRYRLPSHNELASQPGCVPPLQGLLCYCCYNFQSDCYNYHQSVS